MLYLVDFLIFLCRRSRAKGKATNLAVSKGKKSITNNGKKKGANIVKPMVTVDVAKRGGSCFPMMTADFDHKNALSIGYGSGENWEFDLTKNLAEIHEAYPHLNLFVIGYREEERPEVGYFKDHFINAEGDELTQRLSVPFFVIHGLPTAYPDNQLKLALVDYETHSSKLVSLKDVKKKWTLLGNFGSSPTSPKAWMMTSFARTSSRSRETDDRPSTHCGGLVVFPMPVDYYANPGDAFPALMIDGKMEDFPFDDDIWEATTEALMEQVDLEEFVRLPHAPWMDIILGVATEKFLEYYEDDLTSEDHGELIRDQLHGVFTTFKEEQLKQEMNYNHLGPMFEESMHFKIYPNNQFFQKYLSGGTVGAGNTNNFISKYVPKDKVVVYPKSMI